MTDTATLYHNPRCSKSRAALEYLGQSGLNITTIHYLQTPPDRDTLREILTELQLTPRQLMRQSDATYKELNLNDDNLTEDQLLDAMVENPILIERPIVRLNGEAAIGRPLDNIIALIDE